MSQPTPAETVAQMRAEQTLPADIDPKLHAAKVRAGLSHQQAVDVIRQQAAHDKATEPKEPTPSKPAKASKK